MTCGFDHCSGSESASASLLQTRCRCLRVMGHWQSEAQCQWQALARPGGPHLQVASAKPELPLAALRVVALVRLP
eukprot:1037565-Rhodomonas_salina.1